MTTKMAVTVLGAVAFFAVAPGTVAGFIPYVLTGWRVEGAPPGGAIGRVVGAVLILGGIFSDYV